MTIFLLGSDFYSLKQKVKSKSKTIFPLPKFSVIIPAYNEEELILRSVKSVLNNLYPMDKLQLIVVDDGSKDKTSKIVSDYIIEYKPKNILLVRQKNSGKANALNNAIANYANGDLVMCLDSDSYIDKYALLNSAAYFEDPKVSAIASNVKIIPRDNLLNLVQRFEYLICYQMKRAQTLFNIEYIIGGIGSVFRKSVIDEVGYYDGNTVTEDIDLTMKILQKGNKENLCVYASDVIAYSEAVLDIKGLIRQRFRWKWGRCQTFLKNKNMFFNKDKKYSKAFSWFYLPFAIFCDFAFLFEPIMIFYIFYVSVYFNDPITILSAFAVISSYIAINVLAEETTSAKEKFILLLISPTMYVYFFILSFVEYIALVKSLLKIHLLKKSIDDDLCTWEHVKRPAIG